MRARAIGLVCAFALLCASHARAQDGAGGLPPSREATADRRSLGGGGQTRGAGAGEGVGVRAFFLVDRVSMTAADSFDAVLGSSSLNGFGGGVDVTRLWKGLFVRGAVSRLSAEGERAIVVTGETIPLGVALEVEMTPLELGAGWRVPLDPSRRAEAYGGGGLLRLRYKESSPGADPGEDLDESFNGTVFFGGVDFDLSNGFMAGFEAQFRSVPDAIGEGGVSKEFEETNLGGFAIRFVVGFRR